MTATATIIATRNVPLLAARGLAGTLGAFQAAGAVYFLFIATDEAVWRGLLIDVPVTAVLFTGVLLKLVVAFAPGIAAARRIGLGLLAVGLGLGVGLVKIPVYDEPEGVLFLVIDLVLGGLLLLARRADRQGRDA